MHNPKILIVEDEMISALALQDTLERSGFEVTDVATSGAEAFAALDLHPPDLVLMDINLQEKEDGIIVGKKILQEYRLPVVFVTAYADRETISRAREAFPYGYIVKPWREGELLAVLETALYKHLADQRARELQETRNKFFSIIGHDLRSPLAALSLTTRTLLKHLESLSKEEIKEFIQDIHHTTENLYALTDNMLEWAKVQSGRLELRTEVLLLQPLADEVRALMQGKAASKEIRMEFEIPAGLKVLADKNMVRSVLLNLVSNGLKFSYPGGSVCLSATPREGMAEVSVVDKGVGMDNRQLEELLAFNIATHTPGTHEEKGTGLGLLLSKEFVEANGGSFTISSKQHIGTSVTFTLPLA